MGAFTVEGQIPHLVDDQKMELRERLNPLFEFILPVRSYQSLNETGCICIVDPESLSYCFVTESQGQMGLPHSREIWLIFSLWWCKSRITKNSSTVNIATPLKYAFEG